MNPNSKTPDAQDNLSIGEKIEEILRANGVPVETFQVKPVHKEQVAILVKRIQEAYRESAKKIIQFD